MKALRLISGVLICLLIPCDGKTALKQQSPSRLSEEKLAAAEWAYQQGVELLREHTAQSTRDAISRFREAQQLYAETGYKQGEADALFSIGVLSDGLGRLEDAISAYKLALKVAGKVFWERESSTRSALAGIYLGLEEYDKAIELYLLNLQQLRLGGFQEHSGNAESHSQLAGIYFRQALTGKKGGFGTPKAYARKALNHYTEALDLYVTRAVSRAQEVHSLIDIGNVYAMLGDKRSAQKYYAQAASRGPEGQHVEGRVVYMYIGDMYANQGDLKKALDSYQNALDQMGAQGRSQPGVDGLLFSQIGKAYAKLGQKKPALEYLTKALAIIRSAGQLDLVADLLFDIASFERESGNYSASKLRIDEAIEIIESERTYGEDKNLRSSFFAVKQRFYAFSIDLLMQMHRQMPEKGYDRLALEISERTHARALIELLKDSHADIRQGVDAGLVKEERLLIEDIRFEQKALAETLSGDETEDKKIAAKKKVATLIERLESVRSQIRANSPRYASLKQPAPLDIKQIQSEILDSDTALLEYYLSTDRSYLWVVAKNSLSSYELLKGAQIEAAAVEFLQSLRSPGLDRKSRVSKPRAERVYLEASGRPVEALARKLSAMLLSPAASTLANKRLVVIPDGALQYVPFAALADPSQASKWEPLIVRHEIVNLPSVSALAAQRREFDGRKPAPKIAIVIADPVFSADDTRVTLATQRKTIEDLKSRVRRRADEFKGDGIRDGKAPDPDSAHVEAPPYLLALTRAVRHVWPRATRADLPRLPGTRIEAEEVIALAGANTAKALDFAANRATATGPDLGQYRYIHFATHGLIDSQNPELSALLVSLVDERGQAQDGYIRAHEIFNLNLSAELVVLSACETGLGRQVRGEGLVGLTRGFMYAGAKGVVVSLWNVNDRSTAELMTRFYKGMLKGGKRPAEALRAAQIELRNQKEWHSPYYWAPFVLEGEWQ